MPPLERIAAPIAGSFVRGFVAWRGQRVAAVAAGWQWDDREDRWLECAAINLEQAARLGRECRASAARPRALPIWAESAAHWCAWAGFWAGVVAELTAESFALREAA